ncbi:phage portal protein family protein [Dysgonomonas termitidis]|uniref:DUF935 family protein n=1 Tax=Dysgonomonas termitidis TaxID=1516126 RepID=A0ABV9KUV6_9BACT
MNNKPFKDRLNPILIDKWGNPMAALPNVQQNARKLSADKTIVAKIIGEFKDRQRAEIKKWQQAMAAIRNPDDPRAYLLQDLYDNLESDGHFISERELRKAATLCAEFSIIDRSTGAVNNEKTDLFREEWFYSLRADLLDCIFKGVTILELTNPLSLDFEVVPRRNVQADTGRVFLEASGSKYIDYRSGLYAGRIIQAGKNDSLGLMADLCGQLIWKRNAQQSWAEYTEKYGQPLITATTNKISDSDIQHIQDMLDTLGEAARAVLPEGTTIKIEQFTGGDSYKVYDMQIERINTEISKPMIGGTMLTSDGSSRSQSEVHERNLNEKIAARDKLMIEYIVNGQLIPIMQRWGHAVNPDTDKFVHNDTFELSVEAHWQIVSDAISYFDVPVEWISKTFNMPITGLKKQAAPNPPEPGANEKKPKAHGGGFSANFR